ncbi:hypothetical protein JCM1393_18910 [Clostridium carnis]
MRKPSIFSRDYERKMRKRRRIITTIFIVTFFTLGFTAAVLTAKNFDFTNIKAKVQQWVDKGKIEEEKEKPIEEKELEEKIVEPEVKILELKVNNSKVLKIEYEDKNGEAILKEVKELPDGIYYSISNNKKSVVTIDESQNIKVFNNKGEEKVLTKDSYTSPKGETFKKDIILETYKGYYWNKEAKFINDNKIAYISNVPYFGYDLNKYIWVIDISSNTHTTLWGSKGKDVKLGEVKEKGLEVLIDGNVKYVNNDGDLIN